MEKPQAQGYRCSVALVELEKMAENFIRFVKKDYRIYSINRPGRLLNFWTLRVGAYSRLGAY